MTGARWFSGTPHVEFDQAMEESGGLNAGNWLVRRSHKLYSCTAAECDGEAVVLSLGSYEADTADDAVIYSGATPDVRSAAGVLLAAGSCAFLD